MRGDQITGVLFGVAFIVPLVVYAALGLRRRHRLSSWTRTTARIERVWVTQERTTNEQGGVQYYDLEHALYRYATTGGEQTGESTHLKDPKVGESVEVMYDPAKPMQSRPVHGGSRVGRTVAAVFAVLAAALGVFLILVALEVFSM